MTRNKKLFYVGDRLTAMSIVAVANTLSWVRALPVVLLVWGSVANHAQAQEPLQLFTQVSNQFDETPLQAQRLKLINDLPTTKSVQLIRINQNALTTSDLAVSLPGVGSLSLERTGGEASDVRNFTWTGVLREEQAGGTTMVSRNGEITGSISTPMGLYRITPLGGGMHALVQVDSAKFPRDEPESFRAKEFQNQQLELRGGSAADAGQVQIDVLVAYTPAAKAGVADIDATIALAVAEANQSYVNSGIKIRLNLVDSFQVTYTETGKTFDTILANFVANPDVNRRRDQSGADLAALIIDQSDYCGLADAIMASPSAAFAVVYYDCATGYYSFAHELGHLMGARHNEQVDPSTTPFAYGHGYLHLTPPPAWRTIMAYDCPQSCQRLQYWSNPRINYGTQPMGTAAINDNARVLNETAATVSAFRTRPR
jgi:peptidyl-Asp metalloendopeptidase